MTLVLAMIVRDEAHAMAATLASALPFVDAWLIADTGSVDGTPDVVHAACAGTPGTLIHVPFVNFSQARNAIMDAAEAGSVLVWLDAEDRLLGGEHLRALAAQPENCWALRHEWSTGARFTRPTVVRAGSGWRFHGRVHESLRHPSERDCLALGASVYQERTPVNDAKTRARQLWDVAVLRYDAKAGDARAARYLELTLAAIAARTAV